MHADVAGQFTVAALKLHQHAGRAVVMGIAADTAAKADNLLDLEHLADAIVEVVELLLQRRGRLARRRLGQ